MTALRVGALAPLSRPGWIEAGSHLLAGMELAVVDVNDSGGIAGRPLQLVVRDTAADPHRAEVAVDELVELGVVALVGEYHSVVARAVAQRADALEVPFVCASAVLDVLTEKATDWVARLAPPQSLGWRCFGDFLHAAGHRQVAVLIEPSVYWEAGARILRADLALRGCDVVTLEVRDLPGKDLCDALAATGATAALLLVGSPRPAVSIVRSVRRDERLAGVLIGAPAGQSEATGWDRSLGPDGSSIPYLRYRGEDLTPLGDRVEAALLRRLDEPPSFVALEGYDAVAVLAEGLRRTGRDRGGWSGAWPRLVVEGTRGVIELSRPPGGSVWQWSGPPIQVVERDPSPSRTIRVLHAR